MSAVAEAKVVPFRIPGVVYEGDDPDSVPAANEAENCPPRDVEGLRTLCEEIDAFLEKPMPVQASDRGNLVALCRRAGVVVKAGELTDIVSARLKDKRYDLGVNLDNLRKGTEPQEDESPAAEEPTEVESDEDEVNRDAARLADYQREWEERNDEIRDRIVDIDQEVHGLEKQIAPLNSGKRELVKEKKELLTELGARTVQGPPTELPPPEGPKQTAFDFDGEEKGEPQLVWSDMHDHRRDVPYLHANSAKKGEGDSDLAWRIYAHEGAYTLHESDPELGPPDESVAYEDQDRAKGAAEKVERAIHLADKQRAQLAAMDEDTRYRSVALVHFGLTEKLLERLAEAGIVNIGQYEDAEKSGELTKIKGIGESTRSKIADSLVPFWEEWKADHEVALAKFA